ncbi:hypothetical protein F5Y07DRAFT_410611 [Xylaria sp. FL0933]|nr:hypothetical protein F5Y07DRAFT_410611 [Xylaria sp. FL0933]
MNCPQEIIDQIIEYSVEIKEVERLSLAPEPEHLKGGCEGCDTQTVQWDIFTSCEYNPPSEEKEREDQSYKSFTYPSFSRLHTLRLVSRSWNLGASRILRRYSWCHVNLMTMAEIEQQSPDNVDHIIATRGLSNRFNISSTSPLRPLERWTTIYDLDIHLIREENPEDSEQKNAAEDKMLVKLVNRLTNVQTFSANLKAARPYRRNDYGPDTHNISFFNRAMDTILLGLRSQAFENLVDLRLALISMHDAWKLVTGVPDNVKRQLKHLYVETIKTFLSGPWNDKEPLSEIWSFVESCNNLESLGLHSDSWLNLNTLNWKLGPNSKGLRSLYLNHACVTASSLISLLEAGHSDTEKPVTRRVQFVEVCIHEGDWSTVFDWLMDCPSLEFFDAHEIGYTRFHPSAYLRWGLPPNMRADRKIWSRHSPDISSLKAIMHKLAEKAGGASRYPADLKALSCL